MDLVILEAQMRLIARHGSSGRPENIVILAELARRHRQRVADFSPSLS